MEYIIGFLIAIVASAVTIIGTGWIANQMMGDPPSSQEIVKYITFKDDEDEDDEDDEGIYTQAG